ncbi:XRE family transcriptional regulator [Pseudonocardia sp. TMWB2A]|uniref:helix-turn-helix transcriptional regulator n=1 Tax=Pseudonocardia sp. TMWB2A TaxID=687430 RepID=UPI00307ECFF8
MTVQIVKIAGQKIAMLPFEEYRKLMDVAEDKADEQVADALAARRDAGEEYLPVELADRIMDGENPLRVWRTYRGLTQGQLGQEVNRQAAFISKLESGEAEGGVGLWARLADALGVTIEDIAPVQ